MSVNRIVLIGRLTKDPELKVTQSGKSVVDFSIAVNKRIKPQEGADADFFRVKAWGQTAEYISNYIGKGRLVAVDGRLETRRWQDQNGTNRETIEVIAENVSALDRAKDEAGTNTSSNKTKNSQPSSKNVYPPDDYDPFEDE